MGGRLALLLAQPDDDQAPVTPLPPPSPVAIPAREHVDRGATPDADLAGWIVVLALLTALLLRATIGG